MVFIMARMIGYMLTWTMYGTWLQGDKRGYVKDSKVLGEDRRLYEVNQRRLKGRARRLDKKDKIVVRDAILSEAKRLGQEILAIAVCSNHVHVVVNCVDEPLEVVVARYKKAGRLALRETGFEGRVWTRGYDKRFCFDEVSLEERIRYVKGHDS
jgi:REP element-mobilizing transposase RayT